MTHCRATQPDCLTQTHLSSSPLRKSPPSRPREGKEGNTRVCQDLPCAQQEDKKKRCSVYTLARYCSRASQLEDWMAHEVNCKRAKEALKHKQKEERSRSSEEKEHVNEASESRSST